MNVSIFNNLLKYFKYGIVGGTGAIIDFTLYSSIIYTTHINYLVSNIFSFSIAAVVVFFLQKNYTFQYKTNKNLETFNRYILAVVITYILSNVILTITIELLAMGLFVSKAIQIILGSIWGYYVNNYYVFNDK